MKAVVVKSVSSSLCWLIGLCDQILSLECEIATACEAQAALAGCIAYWLHPGCPWFSPRPYQAGTSTAAFGGSTMSIAVRTLSAPCKSTGLSVSLVQLSRAGRPVPRAETVVGVQLVWWVPVEALLGAHRLELWQVWKVSGVRQGGRDL